MRTYLILLLFLSYHSYGQITIGDDFSDGDFTQNPTWSGDTSQFIVNSGHQLQLLDTAAGQAYLSTPSAVAENATWQFHLKMDFNPSGSNFAKVYLMSDQAQLNQPLNGYFIRFSGSPDDRIGLFRQSGSTEAVLLQSAVDLLDRDPVDLGVQVQRSANGVWQLAIDTTGAPNWVVIDSLQDQTHRWSSHFGLQYEYTKTRADKFFFDDLQISGRAYVDNHAPRLDSITVLSPQKLLLSFNETVSEASAENPQNYSLNGGIGQPALAVRDFNHTHRVELSFIDTLENKKPYRLSLQKVADSFGNDSVQNLDFTMVRAEVGDIVINELMPDPVPSVGFPPQALPEREYIELYNRSNYPVNLKNFTLIAGSSTEILPFYTVPADSFVVITKDEGVNEFPSNIPLLGIDLSSVALTNSGTTVSLLSPEGVTLSSVSYTKAWYGDSNKEEGGWSLEQIDPNNQCGGAQNWRASTHPSGGTPGQANSVLGSNPDSTAPRILRISLPEERVVLLHFSETLPDPLLNNIANYRLNPGIPIDSLQTNLPRTQVKLFLNQALVQSTIYRLWLKQWPQDCSGNTMRADTLRFAIPTPAAAGDVVINEILFNPRPEGVDFVEVYNSSEKVLDLSMLVLGHYLAASSSISEPEPIVEESYLFFPGRYLALCTDTAALSKNYQSQNLVQVMDLPSMPNDEGSLALATLNLQLIDGLLYSDDQHLAVLESTEGVSLERLSANQASSSPSNWHSAAATAGYATPGYQNSQYFQAQFRAQLIPEPKVFSPNQDGYHDQVKIAYRFAGNNNVVNLSIFDANGSQLRELLQGQSTGPEGFFTWDGTDDQGQLLNRGVYIIVLDYFNEKGQREILKKTCILSR